MRNSREFSPMDIAGGVLGLIAGLWLIASPFILGYDTIGKVQLTVHGAQTVEDASSAPLMTYIGGAIILVLALFTLVTARMPQFSLYRVYAGVAMILTGIVLMAQPYFSEYDGVAKPLYNMQICGALVIIIAGFTAQALYNRLQTRQ